MGTEHGTSLDPRDNRQRRTLLQVTGLNAGLFAGLIVAGLASESSALIANALDNLSDAAAYALSFFAVTRSDRWKAAAASVTGVMLLVLAVGVTVDALRRFVVGSEPLGPWMMAAAVGAAAINLWCIFLLRSQHGEDVNMRAAWTMSINDFASNFGILLAGGLVVLMGRNWPDLVVALLIALVAISGGVRTLKDAHQTLQSSGTDSTGHRHD